MRSIETIVASRLSPSSRGSKTLRTKVESHCCYLTIRVVSVQNGPPDGQSVGSFTINVGSNHPAPMLLPSLLSEISSHDLEVAETLIGILRFVLIFVGARTLSEILVRLELPTILGELLAGVIIGASGLHLLVPPETQVQLSGAFSDVIAGMAHIPAEEVSVLYNESFGALQSVATLGLYSLLFLTGLESELDELMAVGKQAFSVAVVGVVLPFALGTLGLMSIFHVDAIPAIFAGASMTATSIGITASVFGAVSYTHLTLPTKA